MITTIPNLVWKTPAEWGQPMFIGTWAEVCEIADSLRTDGVEAYSDQASQYSLIGSDERGLPRGWYQQPGYETADGKTIWTIHCVELGEDLTVLRECFHKAPKPAVVSGATERAMLMECLANA